MAERGTRRAWIAAALLLAVALVALGTQALPRALRANVPTSGTPVPFGSDVAATIPLGPSAQACEPRIALDPSGARATIAAHPTGAHGGPPLRLTLSGAGYRAQATIPGGYRQDALTVAVTPPPRALIGSACVRNVGRRPVSLLASGSPRVLTRTRASVDGREHAAAFMLTFSERGVRTPLARTGDLIGRAATFSAVGPWLYWLLLPLLLLGVPLAVAAALLLALRAPDEGPTDR
ncbi:MAG: hypothetical protein ACTHOE_02280 [Conexibacter sp.]